MNNRYYVLALSAFLCTSMIVPPAQAKENSTAFAIGGAATLWALHACYEINAAYRKASAERSAQIRQGTAQESLSFKSFLADKEMFLRFLSTRNLALSGGILTVAGVASAIAANNADAGTGATTSTSSGTSSSTPGSTTTSTASSAPTSSTPSRLPLTSSTTGSTPTLTLPTRRPNMDIPISTAPAQSTTTPAATLSTSTTPNSTTTAQRTTPQPTTQKFYSEREARDKAGSIRSSLKNVNALVRNLFQCPGVIQDKHAPTFYAELDTIAGAAIPYGAEGRENVYLIDTLSRHASEPENAPLKWLQEACGSRAIEKLTYDSTKKRFEFVLRTSGTSTAESLYMDSDTGRQITQAEIDQEQAEVARKKAEEEQKRKEETERRDAESRQRILAAEQKRELERQQAEWEATQEKWKREEEERKKRDAAAAILKADEQRKKAEAQAKKDAEDAVKQADIASRKSFVDRVVASIQSADKIDIHEYLSAFFECPTDKVNSFIHEIDFAYAKKHGKSIQYGTARESAPKPEGFNAFARISSYTGSLEYQKYYEGVKKAFTEQATAGHQLVKIAQQSRGEIVNGGYYNEGTWLTFKKAGEAKHMHLHIAHDGKCSLAPETILISTEHDKVMSDVQKLVADKNAAAEALRKKVAARKTDANVTVNIEIQKLVQAFKAIETKVESIHRNSQYSRPALKELYTNLEWTDLISQSDFKELSDNMKIIGGFGGRLEDNSLMEAMNHYHDRISQLFSRGY